MLLEIDEERLTRPVVWEQGDPPDPGGMLFPHVYEPIPVAAVLAVRDYLPEPDGTFRPPVLRTSGRRVLVRRHPLAS